MKRHRRVLILLCAAVAIAALLAGCGGSTSPTALGAAIYKTGHGHAGPIPRSMGGGPYTTESLPCGGCHGAQGQGAGIGPSITRATLGSAHTITHKPSPGSPPPSPVTEGPWTPDQTVQVVITGKTPEGNMLGGRMPRWQLDSQDASALAAYLATL